VAKNQQFPTGFSRAVQMLSIAIQHVLYGNPDAARTNLRASWDDLKDSAVGRIEHMATTAFVDAVSGKVRNSVQVLEATLAELDLRRYELPPNVQTWVWECCLRTMEYLPYAAAVRKLIGDAYAHSNIGNYAEALHLLTQADSELERAGHLVPPQIKKDALTAWGNILERMLTDETVSARDSVRDYTARMTQRQPAAV
jgi:hypothetical protein